jgi:hypothetical protein
MSCAGLAAEQGGSFLAILDQGTIVEIAQAEGDEIAGGRQRVSLWHAIAHFFNHQQHHRGQVTTLMQAGHDPGERHAHAEARDVTARAARARRTGPIVQVLYMQGGNRSHGTSLGPSGRGRAAAIRRSARSCR